MNTLFDSDKDVADCAKRIRQANDKFGKQFSSWIQAVGGELRKAQELLASHKAGFEKWCKVEFGWGTSQVYQIINAKVTIDILTTSAIAEVNQLPTNEAQLRELSKVAEDDVVEVWQAVVTQAEAEHKPITAKLVREHVEKHRQAECETEGSNDDIADASDGCEPQEHEDGDTNENAVVEVVPAASRPQANGKFNLDEATFRITDWLHAELDKWPEKHRHLAAHWIREILEKDYEL